MCSFGYRGEALASIVDVCEIVEIVSRHKFSKTTYFKCFNRRQEMPITKSTAFLGSPGTSVTIKNIFYSVPVRQKSIQIALETSKIRNALSAIALVHPKMSLTVCDQFNAKIILQSLQTESTIKTFSLFYGKELAESLKHISSSSSGEFTVTGYISTEGHHNKSLQFVYVNKRFVDKTQIHSHVNDLLANYMKQITQGPSVSSQMATTDKFAVYLLDITCSHTEYGICIEAGKSLVEFSKWDGVLDAISKAVKSFLKEQNFISGICTDLYGANISVMSKGITGTQSSDDILSSYGIQSKSAKRSLFDNRTTSTSRSI